MNEKRGRERWREWGTEMRRRDGGREWRREMADDSACSDNIVCDTMLRIKNRNHCNISLHCITIRNIVSSILYNVVYR